jgi:Domain of unknown function (DUF4105)
MTTLRRFIFFQFFFLAYSSFITAQTDSCHLRISLLTVTPGDELYATFGHSALRVYDSVSKQDIVYNYGTFNFDEPGFYTKFIRGKLLYYLSTADFNSFSGSYAEEKRGITEQLLDLDCAEKSMIMQKIEDNLLEQNKFYKYDFLFDNCTTRLRDLVERSTTAKVYYGKVVPPGTTFRNLIYEYLDYNHKEWSKLGIDLLLGSKTDKIMSNREAMFLPDYLMKTFDSTLKGNQRLVTRKEKIYEPDLPANPDIYISPILVFSVLFLLLAAISFSKNKVTTQIMIGFDGFFFFIIGLLSLLMIFMWFGTDHVMCRNNYNLLWAWPSHVVAAFYMYSRKKIVKNYFRFTAIANFIMLIAWFFLPQALNTSVIPILLIMILRSLMHSGLVVTHGRIYKQEL